MKKIFVLILLFDFCAGARGQATFKAGWSTYPTATLIHEYTYNYTDKDSIKFFIADSTNIFATADSSVVMSVNYPVRQKYIYKTISYFNAHKKLVKCEEYTNDNLQTANEYKYDEKNRVSYHLEDNKASNKSYRKTYEYMGDKKSGEQVVSESAYLNGRIEFYTKSYYNRANEKYKEVRLNDNNKDIVHVETFTYGDNGRLKERSVYFPEWKVTRKFPEVQGSLPVKCFNTFPIGPAEIVNLNNRIYFMRRLLLKNQALLYDKDCTEFEYKFTNKTNCDITVVPTKVNHGRQITFRYKQKM
jgi:hypothetical protein